MNQIALILGVGITSVALLWFTFLWDKKEHIFLRLLGSFVFVAMLFLIPTSLYYDRYDCDFVMTNQTVTGAITTFEYDTVCDTDENPVAFTFYRAYTVFSSIFVIYFFIYLIYRSFISKDGFVQKLIDKVRRR